MGRRLRATVTALVCVVGLAVGLTLPLGAAAGEPPAKEVGIRGVVERGASEGSYVIKVPFGQKKVIAYEVPPDCPKARELATMLGKTVEAKGVMKKGPGGENVFVVSDCVEPAKTP